MNFKELTDFKLADAVKFHNELNPALFTDEKMNDDVRSQLLEIAQDFLDELGVSDLEVKDITISGSNAAYTYTDHSDIDLHILVDIDALRNDEIYRELFTAKKTVYNDSHDIMVRGYDVELYVQDVGMPVQSLGEYSVLKNKWVKHPVKRRANFDEKSAREKFTKLVQLAQLALESNDSRLLDNLLSTIKKYRQAGLDKHGEFGSENLAFKALRSKGIIDKLYKHRAKLHSVDLSLDESEDEYAPPGAPYKDTMRVLRQTAAKMNPKKSLICKSGREISGSYTDQQMISMGFIWSDTSKKWCGTERRWSQLSRPMEEDYDPNGPPPGPEFKPTMPAGTVKVDVSDVYDWYKLGQHISDLEGLGQHDFGQGPPSTIMAFGSEEAEHKYIDALKKTGLATTDIDPVDPKQPKGMRRQKVDPTYNVSEASGYIPSEKEKNDPRFKTALTVDVKPDSIKKNAKAFGFNVTRAGVPPLLRK